MDLSAIWTRETLSSQVVCSIDIQPDEQGTFSMLINNGYFTPTPTTLPSESSFWMAHLLSFATNKGFEQLTPYRCEWWSRLPPNCIAISQKKGILSTIPSQLLSKAAHPHDPQMSANSQWVRKVRQRIANAPVINQKVRRRWKKALVQGTLWGNTGEIRKEKGRSPVGG